MPLFNFRKKETIFDKKKEASKDTDVMKSVFAKEEEEKGSKDRILGSLPELDQKIVGAFDPSKRNLKIVRGLFVALATLSVIVVALIFIEMNPNFDLLSSVRGQNTAQQYNSSKADLLTLQTSINHQNYILLNTYLQQLSYLSDTYAKSRNDETVTRTQLGALQSAILVTYENALAKWKEPIKAGNIPVEEYQNALKAELQDELKLLNKEEKTPEITAQIENYRATYKLVGNKNLSEIFNKNTDDIRSDLPRDDTKMYELTQDVLGILNNDFSTIHEIEIGKVSWTTIVSEIERITKSVDNLYNTGFFADLGGIQYSSFDFDASSNEIIVVGRAKRDDGSTFSLVSNLMDAYDKSDLFSDVENRSYPKAGSDEEGYISPFRIQFKLNN